MTEPYRKPTSLDFDAELFDQPPVPDGGRVRYVLCSTPRSGSYLVCRQLLNAGLGVPHEYFHARHGARLSGRWGVDLADGSGYLRAVFARRTTPNGVWGTKLHWDQYARHRVGLDWGVMPGAKLVFLYRSDILAQAVSLHLSRVTGLWGFDATRTTAPWAGVPLTDPGRVPDCARELTESNAAWRAFFRGRGADALVVRYEDFAADQPGHVRKIAEYLQVPAEAYRVPPPEPPANDLPAEMEAARRELLARLRPGWAGG